MIKKVRRFVELSNFSSTEGECSCGCHKRIADELMIRNQAFVYILSAKFGCLIRCRITGGARCLKKQKAVYDGKGITPTPTSYHTGKNRDGVGDSYAYDAEYDKYENNQWVTIPREVVAYVAKESKLFGGVIHKLYVGDSSDFVHFDLGPVREL